MVSWKLKVKDYGKIESAEIEAAPLTLFVGDNNSGKSYLLSLLWAIQNMGIDGLIGNEGLNTEESRALTEWVDRQIEAAEKAGNHEVSLEEVSDLLSCVLNDGLRKNKVDLIRRIFNSNDVNIGVLEMEIGDLSKEVLHITKSKGVNTTNITLFTDGKSRLSLEEGLWKAARGKREGFVKWALVKGIYGFILGLNITDYVRNSGIYLPAARTGFMLTKDIINKVGRQNTFNMQEEKNEIAPFTRPINHFLDVMGDLTLEEKSMKKKLEIADDIEREMAEGVIDIDAMPNKEVRYTPRGKKRGMPLRIVSAVVTELSPLILILKHKSGITSIYYEEPEMCLHPQLQQKMGKIIGRLVNAQITMAVTTHSDIILQHINNMIKLSGRQDRKEICGKLGYCEDDLLSAEKIRVYQLKVNQKHKTEVTLLPCGKDGFVVPTFNDALDNIMNDAYEIQG